MRKVEPSLLKKLKEKGALCLFVLRQLRRWPKNLSLYEKALRRKNAENTTKPYQRMEFLGDAVIDLAVAEHLYQHYPKASEGDMTEIKSRMVNREALAAMSKFVGLHHFIDVPPHLGNGSSLKEPMLSDAMESFVAAVHLDKGYSLAKRYFLRVTKQAFRPEAWMEDSNYKGQLVQWGQKHKRRFFFDNKLLSSNEAAKNKYKTSLYIGEEWVSTAVGKNRKHAEQKASKKALQQLNIEPK